MRHRWTALVLLLAGAGACFAWQAYPKDAETIALVMYASQAAFNALCLALLALAYRSWAMAATCLMFAAFNVLLVGCSAAWFIAPWPDLPGDEMCSAGLNVPVGVGVSLLLLWVVLKITTGDKQ